MKEGALGFKLSDYIFPYREGKEMTHLGGKKATEGLLELDGILGKETDSLLYFRT